MNSNRLTDEQAQKVRALNNKTELASTMTKREAFAAQIMAGLASNPHVAWDTTYLTAYSVQFADALLLELEAEG